MQELESIQPEESQEDREAVEATEAVEAAEVVEEQALDDATHDPGARVEETQSYEQAEAVESALDEAVSSAEEAVELPDPGPPPESMEEDEERGGVLPVPIPEPAMEEEDPGREAPEAVEEREPVSAEEVLETLSEEQKAALDGLDPGDKEALLRVIGQSQEILPDQVPGHSGGFIY